MRRTVQAPMRSRPRSPAAPSDHRAISTEPMSIALRFAGADSDRSGAATRAASTRGAGTDVRTSVGARGVVTAGRGATAGSTRTGTGAHTANAGNTSAAISATNHTRWRAPADAFRITSVAARAASRMHVTFSRASTAVSIAAVAPPV